MKSREVAKRAAEVAILVATALGTSILGKSPTLAQQLSYGRYFDRASYSPSVTVEIAPRTTITHEFPTDPKDPEQSWALAYLLTNKPNGRALLEYEVIAPQRSAQAELIPTRLLSLTGCDTRVSQQDDAGIIFCIPNIGVSEARFHLPLENTNPRTVVRHTFEKDPDKNPETTWEIWIHDRYISPAERNAVDMILWENHEYRLVMPVMLQRGKV